MSKDLFSKDFPESQFSIGIKPPEIQWREVIQFFKDLEGATPRTKLNSIVTLLNRLNMLKYAFDDLSLGNLASLMETYYSKFHQLRVKVDTKEIKSGKKFAGFFEELKVALVDTYDKLQTTTKEVTPKRVELPKSISLSDLLKKKVKQKAFIVNIPIITTMSMTSNFKSKVQKCWDVTSIYGAGSLLKGVQFLFIRKSLAGKIDIKDYITALIRAINLNSSLKVVPYFDVSVETGDIKAVLLVPEERAGILCSIFTHFPYKILLDTSSPKEE